MAIAPEKDPSSIRPTRDALEGFRGYYQAQGTWCWAAVASSVVRYYREQQGQTRSYPQCYFVGLQHPGPACRHSKSKDSPHPHGEIDCFENGCSIHDNPEIGRARAALDDDTIQVFGDILDRPIEWDMICNEINHDRPIIIRTKNADVSYHLLAIIGYDSDVPSIALWDPAMGIRIESYNALQRRVGVWTHTVLTQPPGAGAFNIQ